MADETSQEEPSMEEILASIRRIISEDGEEEGEGAAEAGADADADGDAAADAVAAEDGATAADGGAAEEVAAEAVVAEAPAEEAGAEEVLELTEEVDAQGNVIAEGADEASAFEADTPAPAPAAMASSAPDLVVDMSDSVAEPLTPVEPPSTLMENVAEGAAAGAFAALASQIGPGRADNNAQQVTPGGRTIEDHVLEMLRPMLREWLDKHLPQMVQRLVQREIDRIIHRSDPV
jgi:cell pole-organizing protein PopZ